MAVEASDQLFEGDEKPEVIAHQKPVLNHKVKYFWMDVSIVIYFHVAALYGLYLTFTNNTKWQTIAFVAFLYVITKIGVTAGVHRYWAHKSYKATTPLRLFLMIAFTLSLEGKVYVWARDHRLHHKFQETHADPYNARRGFWFAHLLWLVQNKHPEVLDKEKVIDMDDLKNDKIVMFQKKYHWPMVYVICLALPTLIPWYYWGESLNNAWHVAVWLRSVISYHGTFMVNSFAHLYGNRPFEARLFARENPMVSFITLGEGWHNYHHTFPWDYKASEMGIYGLNWTTVFINAMAKIGLAYDLKTASPTLVRKRALRTGDGTYKNKEVWGWDDKDLPQSDRKEATIIN